jgi:hypothetical protein
LASDRLNSYSFYKNYNKTHNGNCQAAVAACQFTKFKLLVMTSLRALFEGGANIQEPAAGEGCSAAGYLHLVHNMEGRQRILDILQTEIAEKAVASAHYIGQIELENRFLFCPRNA